MVTGAFLGWLLIWSSIPPVGVVLVLLVVAGAISFLMWTLIDVLRCNQHVTGLGIGFASSGLSLSVFRTQFGGMTGTTIPGTDSSVVSGAALLLVLAILPLLHVASKRLYLGIGWNLVGRNMRAADLLGVPMRGVRFAAIYCSVSAALLAGAFLSIVVLQGFTIGLVSGRGWIALCLVIVARWRPLLLFPVCIAWGYLEAWQVAQQAVGSNIPHQFLLALPLIAALTVSLILGGRGSTPQMLSINYDRSGDAS